MEADKRKTNEIICEFMGRRVVDGWVEIGGKFKSSFHSENLVYHLEWDELMPVVARITEMHRNTQINSVAWFDTKYCLLDGDINLVYKRVVDFIKWYNETEIKK